MSSDEDLAPGDSQHDEQVLRARSLLSTRQHQFASLYARGLCVRDICAETSAAGSTIHNEIVRVMIKLGVANRAELAPFFGNPEREFRNLVTLLEHSVKHYGERPLFGERRANSWHWTTYREFAVLVERLRCGLLRNQVVGHVAVISNNRLEWALGAYATYGLASGGCYVPIHEDVSDELLAYMLADSGARAVLVVDSSTQRRVERLRSRLPELRAVLSFQALLSECDAPASLASNRRRFSVPPLACEPAVRFYVLSRWGSLKPVELTHRNLGVQVTSMLRQMGGDRPERGLLHLPFEHVVAGCTELNLTIASGSCAAICEDAVRLGDYISEVRPTRLFALPNLLERVVHSVERAMTHRPTAVQRMFWTALAARNKERRGVELTHSERAAIAAAEQQILPHVRQSFGGELRTVCVPTAGLSRAAAELTSGLGIELYVGYSRVEVSGLATLKRYDGSTSGSLGPPVAGVEIEVDRAQNEEFGELIFTGGCVTDDSIVAAGAYVQKVGLRSRTMGRIDASGELRLEEDARDVYLLANGRFVAPLAVSQAFCLSAYIDHCAVFGAGKPGNVAIIFPQADALERWARARALQTQTTEELLRHPAILQLLEAEVDQRNATLPAHQRVQHFVVEPKDLTSLALYTHCLVINERALYEKYAEISEALYRALATDRTRKRAWHIDELPTPA